MRRIRLAAAVAGALLTTSGAALAQQAVPVRLGFIPVMGAAQIFVAEGESWTKHVGLAVTTSAFESGPNMIQALSSGTLDVYVAGLAPLLVARARNIDVRVIAATVIEEMGFAAGPALAPIFEGREAAAAFRAYREKAGRKARLATQPLGSGPNTALQHWLWEVAKVDRADAEVIEMGIDATQRAILTGAVEGGTIREPALAIARRQNPNVKLLATGADMFKDFPGVVVAVSGAFVDKHPKAVEELVRLVVRATRLLVDNPERAAPHVGAALGKGLVPNDVILEALRSPQTRFTSDPGRIIEATKRLQDYQVKLGALDKAIPLDGLFDTKVYARAIASN